MNAPNTPTQDETGHIWHEKVFSSMKLLCCMNCGFIKNEDQPNKPCPGPIGVEVRATREGVHTAHTPTPELEPATHIVDRFNDVAERMENVETLPKVYNFYYAHMADRGWNYSAIDVGPSDLREAAAAIARLTAERDKWRDAWMKSAHDEAEAIRERDEMTERVAMLENALEPFQPDLFNDFCPDETPAWYFDDEDNTPSPVTVGDFRRALAAREAK